MPRVNVQLSLVSHPDALILWCRRAVMPSLKFVLDAHVLQ